MMNYEWWCPDCMLDKLPHEFVVKVEPGAESPFCPVGEDHGYLLNKPEFCCSVVGRRLVRDDLGKLDDSGDQCGASWICTGCLKRVTW